MYDDIYDTCYNTFVTLRVYWNDKHPDDLTKHLGIRPSAIQVKGEKDELRLNKLIGVNGWFITSKDVIDSKDCRRHIDYLADKLIPVKSKLRKLIKSGAKMDIGCFWQSKSGQGGPTLSPEQLSKLADLGIEFWFDIY